MSESLLLTIQIVNYKTKKYLPQLLKDIQTDVRNADISYEINILDNDSGDDLSDIKNAFSLPSIHFFSSEENKGFGAGHNLLALQAMGRFLLLLNPDIHFIETDTISRLLKHVSENFTVKVVGPQLMTSDGAVQAWDHANLAGSKETAWVSGAVFLIEKNIFDLVGGFDENFFMYKEEEDLCLRIRQAKGRIVYDPKIKVMHLGTENKKEKYLAQSIKYFNKKHSSSLPSQ
jgi:GT2 family glycosyltransferase